MVNDWTRRGAIGAGTAMLAGAVSGAAWGADDALSGLLSDGPDGLLSAALIARRGDGRVALAASAGRRLTPRAGASGFSPFGLDDPFRVASISKMIATAGFMRLISASVLGLDDDVSGPLGFQLRHPAFPQRPITIRQLLSHTSSLRNGPSYPVPAGHALREAFTPGGAYWDDGAWFGPKDKAPGDWFSYADVNFCVLAQIMERKIDERFDRYMTRGVFAPLDLDAGYNWCGVSQPVRDLAAPGCRWLDGRWTAQVDGEVPPAPAVVFPQPRTGPPVAEADLAVGQNGFLFSPQGGLRATLRDLDRLAQAFRSGGALFGVTVVAKDTLESMSTPVWRYDPAHPNGDTGEAGGPKGLFGAYGLGVEIPQGRPGPGGDAFFGPGSGDWRGHLGDAYGWLTGLFWNRVDGRTLVWALNGMRETGRAPGRRSALTPQEEAIIDIGLAAQAS